ncbi:phage minor head protein [Gloeomargarita lithophora]|uniref:phage minor head protein n=1 Tax=Gloeomargarita lithophora TaxID=1188228 RepID=UPI003F7027F1
MVESRRPALCIEFGADRLNLEQAVAAKIEADMVAGAKGAILTDIRAALETGIEQGLGIADFMREFDGISQRWAETRGKDWRARIIWDTNLNQAYAAGRYAHQLDPEVLELMPYLEYVHSDALKPRPHHLALDGKVFRANELPFYPPNGYGCRCRTVSVSERDLQGRSVSEIRRGDLVPYTDERGNPGEARVEPDKGFDAIPGRTTPQQKMEMLERMVSRMPPQIGRFVTQEGREILARMGVEVDGLPLEVDDGAMELDEHIRRSEQIYRQAGDEYERVLFNPDNGGFVLVHQGHNRGESYESELFMAQVLGHQGRRVILLNETGMGAGVKTPDADIDGNIAEFKRLTEVSKRWDRRVQEGFFRAKSQGATWVVYYADKTFPEIAKINRGLESAFYLDDSRTITQITVIFRDGTLKTLTRKEWDNEQRRI